MEKRILNFYGVDGNCFKLDDTIHEAIEDESDGYRSLLDTVVKRDGDGGGLVFFNLPLAQVIVKKVDDGYFQGYHLLDAGDEHLWLRVGTENYDDYYPMFIFQYTPKTDQTEFGPKVHKTSLDYLLGD